MSLYKIRRRNIMLQWFSKKIHNRKGFTLIELVVVIAILGILAAIAVPRYTQSVANAQAAALDANTRVLNSAVTMYIANADDPDAAEAALTGADDLDAAVKLLEDAGVLQAGGDYTGITYTPDDMLFSH